MDNIKIIAKFNNSIYILILLVLSTVLIVYTTQAFIIIGAIFFLIILGSVSILAKNSRKLLAYLILIWIIMAVSSTILHGIFLIKELILPNKLNNMLVYGYKNLMPIFITITLLTSLPKFNRYILIAFLLTLYGLFQSLQMLNKSVFVYLTNIFGIPTFLLALQKINKKAIAKQQIERIYFMIGIFSLIFGLFNIMLIISHLNTDFWIDVLNMHYVIPFKNTNYNLIGLAKKEALTGGQFFSVIGSHEFTRLTSFFANAIQYGYFIAAFSIYLFHKRRIGWFFLSLIELLLTFSKGAYLFIVSYFSFLLASKVTKYWKIWTILYFILLLFALLKNPWLNEATSIGAHLIGLINGIVKGGLWGHGFGNVGNLGLIEGREIVHIVLGESAIGVLSYAMGIIPTSLFYLFLYKLMKQIGGKKGEIIAFSYIICSAFQENLLNTSTYPLVLMPLIFISKIKKKRKKKK